MQRSNDGFGLAKLIVPLKFEAYASIHTLSACHNERVMAGTNLYRLPMICNWIIC